MTIILNKKVIFSVLGILLIVGAVFLFYFVSTNSNTTAAITVLKKGYSKDNKEAFIITAPPNSSNENYENKIVVQEPMVWNLIEKGKVYTINYVSRNNENILKQIYVFDDDKAIE